MLPKLLAFLFFITVVPAIADQKKSKWSYIQRYFPEESLIRKQCSKEEQTFNFLMFKSKKCRSCDYINSMLQQADADSQHHYFSQAKGFLGVFLKFLVFYAKAEKIQSVVFQLLSDRNEQEKWDECDKVGLAVRAVERQRKERLVNKKSCA